MPGLQGMEQFQHLKQIPFTLSRYQLKMKQKKSSCLIWVLILLVAFSLKVSASELSQKIEEYLRENDLQKARDFLLQHLESYPQDREARFLLGKVHFDGDSSLKHLGESIDLTGKGEQSAEALLWMCKYSFLNGSYSMTLEQTKEFEKRFDQSAFLPEILWLSGSSYLTTGYRDEAEKKFGRILEDFPHSAWAPWAVLGLGDCLFSKREFEEAIAQYRKLINSYGDSDALPLALISLCWSFIETKEVEKADLYYNLYRDRFSSAILEQEELPTKIRAGLSEKIKKEKQKKKKSAKYTIEIGTFSSKAQAQNELRRFQAKRYTTRLVEISKDQQVLWRVEVGIFDSKKRAEILKSKLEKLFVGNYRVISR